MTKEILWESRAHNFSRFDDFRLFQIQMNDQYKILNMRKATGKTILLRLSIHCAICWGVIVVKLWSFARVGLRAKDFGGGGAGAGGGFESIVKTLPFEKSFSFSSSSIFTEGMLIVLGKLCEIINSKKKLTVYFLNEKMSVCDDKRISIWIIYCIFWKKKFR